jgi:hypothetical protein
MPDDSATPVEAHDPWARMRDRHCACLRSKEMFYDNGIPLEDRGSSGIFWCSQTFKPLGPDGIVVGVEDCTPGRTCYRQ